MIYKALDKLVSRINLLLVLIFSWDLLTIIKIYNIERNMHVYAELQQE